MGVRLFRLYLAIAMLRASLCLMLAAGNIVEADQLRQATGSQSNPMRPVEHMLLGSIIGLAICTLWIWISARVGQ